MFSDNKAPASLLNSAMYTINKPKVTNLNNRLSNSFINTLLRREFSKHVIELICIRIPIVFSKLQPLKLRLNQKKAPRIINNTTIKLINNTLIMAHLDHLRLQFNIIGKIRICCQLLRISRPQSHRHSNSSRHCQNH